MIPFGGMVGIALRTDQSHPYSAARIQRTHPPRTDAAFFPAPSRDSLSVTVVIL